MMQLNSPKKIEAVSSKKLSSLTKRKLLTEVQEQDKSSKVDKNTQQESSQISLTPLIQPEEKENETSLLHEKDEIRLTPLIQNLLHEEDENETRLPLSQEKSTQSSEYFSTDFLSSHIPGLNINKNASQLSDATVEYDSAEYETVVEQFNSTVTSNMSSSTATVKSIRVLSETINSVENNSSLPHCSSAKCSQILQNNSSTSKTTDVRSKSQVVRNIFPAEKTVSFKTTEKEIQTNESFLEQNSTDVLHNKPDVNNLVEGICKKITEFSKEIMELKSDINQIKVNSPAKEQRERQSSVNKSDEELSPHEGKKSKTDKRYSEENHFRLCSNVNTIGTWVLENFSNVLDDSGTKLFQNLISLDKICYKAFCIRLYTRQDKWNNFDDICTTLKMKLNDEERKEMLDLLVEKQLLITGNKLNIPIIYYIYSYTSVCSILRKPRFIIILKLYIENIWYNTFIITYEFSYNIIFFVYTLVFAKNSSKFEVTNR